MYLLQTLKKQKQKKTKIKGSVPSLTMNDCLGKVNSTGYIKLYVDKISMQAIDINKYEYELGSVVQGIWKNKLLLSKRVKCYVDIHYLTTVNYNNMSY